MEEKFQEILNSQKDLAMLINEQKYGPFCKIKQTPDMDEEFINWLSPKYYAAFEAIYERWVGEKEGIIVSVLREKFLANEETKQKISEFLAKRIDGIFEDVYVLQEMFKIPKFKAEPAIELINKIFASLNMYTLKLDNSEVKERKKEFVQLSLEMVDGLKHLKANRNAEQFIVYEAFTEAIKKVGLSAEQSSQVQGHKQNQNNKNTIAIVIGVILAAFAVIRLIMTLSR